jgi:TonB-linked SusC/RagA family outer membrane protein
MRKLKLLLLGGLLLAVQLTWAQKKTVTGKVTDASGSPLYGISVLEKGTTNGTSTSVSGTFSLSVNENATLVFSAVGFETKEASPGQGSVQVQLTQDARAMSEVVVTGTGFATTKRKIGISVETVTAEKLPPIPNVGQALVGKIPGALISSVNGSPGQPVNILLRGINTLRGGTYPMILLDGIEVRATILDALDINNIERVEVVQGAAAASIYGAQGANGVIQLFSKKGKQGKINIDISSFVAVNELLNVGDLQKARFHSFSTNANNEVIGGSGNPLVFDPAYSHYKENVIWNSTSFANNNNKVYDKNLQWYDHYKMFFGKAHVYNNSISISGGRDRVDFNLTASDTRQETVFKDNGKYSRTNLTSNLGIELFKNLRFRSTSQLVYTKNTQLDPTGRNMFYAINNSRPFANYEYKSPDGDYGAYFGDAVGVNGYNFNYVRQNMDVNDEILDVIQNFNLNYKFPKFVELDAKYGINYQSQEVIQNIYDQSNNLNADYWQYWVEYYPPYWTSYGVPNNKDETGEIDHFQYKKTFQNFLSTAFIRTDFDKDFHLNIPLRTTTQLAFDYRKNVAKTYITYGLDAPTYTPYTSDQMSIYQIAEDRKTPFITYGYLLNQRFEWGDVAGITGGFRSDYSSAFGRGSKPFTFPRGDAYLRLSAMNFWSGKISDIIPEFKLRGAYGQAGIQPGAFDRYIVLNTKNIGSDNTLSIPVQRPNPDLDVEVSKELEIGADMSFNVLKGDWLKSINFSATYWDRKTENAIYPVDLAPSTGTGSIVDNAFSLASHGIQASLNVNLLTNRKFNWNFTTNFSKQTSEITSVAGAEVVVISFAGSSNYVLKAGQKIGQLFGYLGLHSVDEIDPGTKQPFIPVADQSKYTVASNGWVVNKSTRFPYFTPVQYSFGDPNPTFNMAFINDISYGGFINFTMQWDWINGSHLYNQTKEWMYRDGIHKDYDVPLTIDGQTGAWTSFYRGVYAERSRNGTKNYFYEDASFWRLRNIALAVDLNRFIKKKIFTRVQVVLTGRNLATITDYTGMDPEISSGAANSSFDRGVDHNSIPNLKTYQVGLNLGF